MEMLFSCPQLSISRGSPFGVLRSEKGTLAENARCVNKPQRDRGRYFPVSKTAALLPISCAPNKALRRLPCPRRSRPRSAAKQSRSFRVTSNKLCPRLVFSGGHILRKGPKIDYLATLPRVKRSHFTKEFDVANTPALLFSRSPKWTGWCRIWRPRPRHLGARILGSENGPSSARCNKPLIGSGPLFCSKTAALLPISCAPNKPPGRLACPRRSRPRSAAKQDRSFRVKSNKLCPQLEFSRGSPFGVLRIRKFGTLAENARCVPKVVGAAYLQQNSAVSFRVPRNKPPGGHLACPKSVHLAAFCSNTGPFFSCD